MAENVSGPTEGTGQKDANKADETEVLMAKAFESLIINQVHDMINEHVKEDDS